MYNVSKFMALEKRADQSILRRVNVGKGLSAKYDYWCQN